MRKLALSSAIFIFPVLLKAQKDLPDRKWAISFTAAIIPLTDNGQLGIQPGMAYHFNNHFLLLTEVTFQTGKNNNSDPSFLDKKYMRIKPEMRYFFSKTKGFGDYIGLQFSYSTRSFTSKSGYYYDHWPGDSIISYDQARINSPIMTASIQAGGMASISRSFMLDGFIGAGIRSINTAYSDVINPQVSQKSERSGGLRISSDPAYYHQGSQIRFHLNFGIRILYFFPRV